MAHFCSSHIEKYNLFHVSSIKSVSYSVVEYKIGSSKIYGFEEALRKKQFNKTSTYPVSEIVVRSKPTPLQEIFRRTIVKDAPFLCSPISLSLLSYKPSVRDASVSER